MSPHTAKGKPKTSTLVAGSDLVLDAAIRDAGQDRLNHEAIANVVADLTMHAATPVNVAVFGAWGSGKSSFFGLLEQQINATNSKVKVARYDAWKYGGRALKKHFVASVADQIGLGGKEFEDRLAHGHEAQRLDLADWVKTNKKSLAIGLLAAVIVAGIWFALISAAALAVNHNGIANATKYALTTVGTALSLSFAALVVGPKILESAVVKVTEAAPETDDEFARSFETMVAKGVKADSGERLVVFIDELDRCSPEDVVSTLIDLKTFLDAKGCVFVVAADREVLERALREVPQASPVRNEDPYYSTPGAFLDKIFQHQIPLPPLRPQALTRFARELVKNQSGLWADLRAAQEDDRLFLRVVYGLIPVHVRSPRRVKVLLNNYATNVRVAQARGVDWLQRAEELAALTVLETEFPSVAADLVRFPTLLKYLRHTDSTPPSKTSKATVDSYLRLLEDAPTVDASQPETPVAGDLLVDGKSDKPAGRQANKTLVENLLSYLRKIEASGIADPRPDLFYLQSAGAQEGIDDPDLAEVIDFASDYSATDVASKFAEQPSATIATAVRLLSQQAETERGPGRLAIIEAVCLLTEKLDPVDAQAVATVVAGNVLADANSPDWPADATPGALILGVIGASKPLFDALLTRQDAETMAESGALERISSVLNYASPEQAVLIYDLLGSAYYLHPEPLHQALTSTPATVADALWANTSGAVKAALKKIGTPPATPTLTPAGTAQAAAGTPPEPEATPDDTAAERFDALLAAVEGRTDEQAGSPISAVLLFGQEADQPEVRAAASDQAGETINRIADPIDRNRHAMAGLYHSPLSDARWWADLLTESEPAPDGYVVFERLVDALATSDESDTECITSAIPSVIPHIPDDELSSSGHWMRVTLGKTAWSTAAAPTAKNRAAIYRVAETLRPRLNATDAAELDASLVADLMGGLDTAVADDAHVIELLALANDVPSNVAVEVEKQAGARATTNSDIVPTLRLRIAAASRGSAATITSDDVLTVDGFEGEKEAFAEWLALTPPLAEAQKVLGRTTVYTNALDEYAAALAIEERTELWVDLAIRDGTWSQAAFAAIGKHGIASPAVEQTATAIAAAYQQAQRDALVDRLATAKLVEQPPHKAATNLVLQLLASNVVGDWALGARVAILSGGAAHGKTAVVRDAFTAAVASKPNAIKKSHQDQLRKLGLLAKRPKKGLKGFVEGILGD